MMAGKSPTILVTGATGGIGLAVCKRLAKAGNSSFWQHAMPPDFSHSALNCRTPVPAATHGFPWT